MVALFQYMTTDLGLSPTATGVVFAGGFMFSGLLMMIVIAVMATPKIKDD